MRQSLNAVSSGAAREDMPVREMRGMLAPFVLRRLKSSVLKQLVAKTEALEKVSLSETQRSVYDGVLEKSVGAATNSAKEIKNIFTELRKAANHPLLLLTHFEGSGKIDEVVSVLHRASYYGAEASRDMVAKEGDRYSDFDLHQICSKFRQPATPLSARRITVHLRQDGEAEDSPARSREPGTSHPPILSEDAVLGSL
ncbi:unnamed protein product [Ascophyllum nodosum]